MDKSSKYENPPDEYEYDPQLDFVQFLKEAKTYACQRKSVASEEAVKEEFGGTKKPKESWKASIFPWLKADKKHSKTNRVDEQPPVLKSKTKQGGYVTGPVNGIKGFTAQQLTRPTSGPLSGLFNHKKRTKGKGFRCRIFHSGSLMVLANFNPLVLFTW